MSAVVNQIRQAEMLGAIATIYRAAGWPLVIDLHANKGNPKAVSGPDFLMVREGVRRVVKVLGTKGELSAAQEKVRKDWEAGGFEYVVYGHDDFPEAVAAANET